ncbi:odorant receptor 67c-like [Pieris brassicae]|uniref:odorant receptor 67c-like n=1 Tax=Pieris brassicae TaxID=7116 RepID=UPI001E65F7E3|nr:odorant receptor 67c-like [Pieris brassicae]
MHFELLCSRFQKVVTNSKKETEERLRACILQHQELIALVELMEQLYSKSFLFNIMLSSVLICLGGFNIVFSKQFGPIFAFVNFLVMCLYQIFMICYFGDMVVISSSQVGDAIFNSKWYNAELKIKKSLYIVLLRSQKPCTLTAAKFATLNLRAFTTILSTAWSYFALLKTLYNPS